MILILIITHLLALILGFFLNGFFHEMKLSKSNFTNRYALAKKKTKRKIIQ